MSPSAGRRHIRGSAARRGTAAISPRPTGQLARRLRFDLQLCIHDALWFRPCSGITEAMARSTAVRPSSQHRKQVPVSVHRLAESGMAKPDLNDFRVEIRDERRGVKVPQVVESCSGRELVLWICAGVATLLRSVGIARWLAAGARRRRLAASSCRRRSGPLRSVPGQMHAQR